MRDGEPPSVASRSRCGPGRSGVDTDAVYTDVIYTDEGTVEFVELKPEKVNDVEGKVGNVDVIGQG
jgi:hypothetical protein